MQNASASDSEAQTRKIISETDSGWKQMPDVKINNQDAPYCSGDYYTNVFPFTDDKSGKVVANSVQTTGFNSLKLSGDIYLKYENINLISDTLNLTKEKDNTYSGDGKKAYVMDNQIFLYSNTLKIDHSNELSLSEKGYGSLTTNRMRFAFDAMTYNKETGLGQIEQVKFTTCEPGDEEWYATAERLDLNREKNIGEAYDTVIYIDDNPVIYLPYLIYPLDVEKGQTGFLAPSFAIGGFDGLEVVTPFYWRIADNVDYTIYPHFSLHRSMMIENELRWLTTFSKNTVNFAFNPRTVEENESKYMFNINHYALYTMNFYTKIDYYKSSDNQFFNNYNSFLDFPEDSFPQTNTASVGWFNDYIKTDLSLKSYNQTDGEDYYQLPNLSLTLFDNNIEGFSYGGYSSIVYFKPTNEDTTPVKSSVRGNIDMFMEYNFSRFSSLGAVGDVMLYNVDDGTADVYDDNYAYFVPTTYLKLGGDVFTVAETDSIYMFRPKINLVYTPYVEQENPIFDTNYRMFSYSDIEGVSKLNGYDRVGDTFHVSLMAENIFYFGDKKMDINLGQMYYLRDRQMTIDTIDIEKQEKLNQKKMSPLVAKMNLYEPDVGIFGLEHQYDIESSKNAYFNSFYEFHPTTRQIYHIGYTWIDNQFYYNEADDKESFVRFAMKQPLTAMWTMEGSIDYDIINDMYRNFSLVFGRTSCCDEIKFGFQGSTRYSEDDPLSFFLQFAITGITGSASAINERADDIIIK